MPDIVHELGDLRESLSRRSAKVIGIDGYQGAGKTTVASFLSKKLGFYCVHLDDFYVPGTGDYIESLDYMSLRTATERRPLLLEGVCLQVTLNNLSISPDVLVYVFSPEPRDDHPRGTGGLAQEVREYHRAYDPMRSAGIVYVASDVPKEAYQMLSDRAQIDIAYIKAKTLFSIVIAIGGMLALLVGLAVIIFGATGNDETLIKILGLEVSAKGLGAVIMVTSILWAFIAYQSRPQYAHSHESSETFGKGSKLIGRFERESSTQAGFRPKKSDDPSV